VDKEREHELFQANVERGLKQTQAEKLARLNLMQYNRKNLEAQQKMK